MIKSFTNVKIPNSGLENNFEDYAMFDKDQAYFDNLKSLNSKLSKYLNGEISYRNYKISDLISIIVILSYGKSCMCGQTYEEAFQDLFKDSPYFAEWQKLIFSDETLQISRGRRNQLFGLMRFYYKGNHQDELKMFFNL